MTGHQGCTGLLTKKPDSCANLTLAFRLEEKWSGTDWSLDKMEYRQHVFKLWSELLDGFPAERKPLWPLSRPRPPPDIAPVTLDIKRQRSIAQDVAVMRPQWQQRGAAAALLAGSGSSPFQKCSQALPVSPTRTDSPSFVSVITSH